MAKREDESFQLAATLERKIQEDMNDAVSTIDDRKLQGVMAKREDESLNHAVSTIDDRKLQGVEEPCTIYKVLPQVRNEDPGSYEPGSYEPKIISIGPFHRDKEHLKLMENLKLRFLHDLIRRSPENPLPKFIKIASTLEANARNCYSEPVEPDSIAFVKMMVFDGCFIVEFLIKFIVYTDPFYSISWDLPLIKNDILLLENQIPFFVLQSFFDICVAAPELRTILGGFTLVELVLNFLMHENYLMDGKIINDTRIPNTIHHLLHLFHSSLSPTLQPPNHESPRLNVVGPIWLRETPGIPCVTDLCKAGIKFIKKENSRGPLDVSFRGGVMELPLLSVISPITVWLRNFVAFEQCCPMAGSHFTSYVVLMKNLIKMPEDVVLLKRCGVIEGAGIEKLMAFFNSLVKGVFNFDYDNRYARLFMEVSAYESQRWFTNLWAIISRGCGCAPRSNYN